jgi:hypothetical protein
MHLKVLLGLMLVAIFWTTIESRLFTIDQYVRALEPYSGLDPDYFRAYKDHLQQFRYELYKRPNVAKRFLGNAIESARQMTLCTKTADSTVQEELDAKITTIRSELLKKVENL